MAKFSESVHVAAAPEKAWVTASDLSRLTDWMVMFEAWRSDVPEELAEGTELSAVVSVKGMRNRIAFTISSYDPPRALTLSGEGVGGTKVALTLSVRPDRDGSRVEFDVDFSGPLVVGPIGMAVKRALKGEVRKSVDNLSALID